MGGRSYERKRGEFSDGLHFGYIDDDLLVNRERLVRIGLACEYRVNETRSSISKYFKEADLSPVLKVKDVNKYAYGYEVFRLLDLKQKEKPTVKGDRYHIKKFGQALRYGQYSVVAVCVNLGLAANKQETEILEIILMQWTKFEAWAQKLQSNESYRTDSSFDYVNYYKGSTINTDLKAYSFTV